MNEIKKPAIRFQWFFDEWEKRSIGELTEELHEYATLDSSYPLLTSSREGIMFQDEYRSNRTTENNETLFSVVPYGKCTYRHMSDDDIFHFNINDIVEKGLVSREYPVFDSTDNNDLRFIVALLNSSEQFRRFCRERKMGGTRTRLYYKHLSNFKPRCPMFNEQRSIADFLDNINSLLSHHQSKLKKLQALKASMLEKMFPKDGADVPEVRFKGFTGAWERRKLDHVFIDLQNNTLSRSCLSFKEGLAKDIHYGDVLVRFGEVLDIKIAPLPAITDESIIIKYKKSFLRNGDIIVADTAEDEAVGKCTEIVGINSEVVIAGLHTIPYRPLIYFAPGYLGYYMNSPAYHNQLLPFMQGIKVTSISKSSVKETTIAYPQSIDEQKQIGNYFCQLDNLITLRQQELDKLQSIKKALLEKMFF
ncbi:restriction endonuclease subunit S [Anaerotruncus sp. DFI.9.16]|uniref:restriction endonuclease subunit S n=1 Tax=Anaerotruncus sp. DFI.9.16 TaxID=2965275 RepID=UPI0021095597|nr:restriction endonuclease subunit S [Anaerotruncus sp. DFI.9.16]MCQ4897001.1 restriction endonuclease subunit S [Anaerotruncus sp. DFI.9.16]